MIRFTHLEDYFKSGDHF